MRIQSICFILALTVLTLAGCAGAPVYKQIQKDNATYNSRTFTATSEELQKALSQMLLSKKFQIDKEDDVAGIVLASRYFTHSRNNTVVVLQGKMFAQGEGRQKLFLNAIETTQRNYVVDRTRFLLWVVPLPGGGGKEVTKTKESEASIEDASFYTDLFDAVGRNLK
ncbi:MAG: hypothetical protein WCH62_06490 [Candidatus Omnitrophota bacterium]